MSGTEASEYDILQVRIDRDSTGAYQTLAMGPDGRTARGTFQLSISDDELDDFVRKVGLVRRRRGPADDRLRAIKEFGSILYNAVFKDQVGSVYNSAKAAAFDGNRRLRISLRLSGAPELLRLPWEFLYDRPRFIAQSTDTPLVRSLDVGSGRRPQHVTLPLRILGIVSSPVGYEELDANAERQNLEAALEPLRRDGVVELVWLERATLRELGRRVSEPDEIHVIHYIGHGAYDEATEAGILILERSDGRAAEVSGEVLGAMLQDERSLRLVVLNSCEGARTSHFDPFSGVATSLIEFNIPAVVGMQFEITDDAAIAFSDALYRGLAQGMPIDAAVAPARRAIMSIKEAEFGTPVLFLRDGDAHLFEIDSPPTSAFAPGLPTRPIPHSAPKEERGPHAIGSPERTAQESSSGAPDENPGSDAPSPRPPSQWTALRIGTRWQITEKLRLIGPGPGFVLTVEDRDGPVLVDGRPADTLVMDERDAALTCTVGGVQLSIRVEWIELKVTGYIRVTSMRVNGEGVELPKATIGARHP